MIDATESLLQQTAVDLMSREVIMLNQSMKLREAAHVLLDAGVHGAPVVDENGRCVGALSVTDLARWAMKQADPPPSRPRTCSHQEMHRETRGRESVLCTLDDGKCYFQSPKVLENGRTAMECREPNCVCLEWQMVELEQLPADDVQHYMTSNAVVAEVDTPIGTLAKMMNDESVHRIIIVDSERRPIGIVSSTNLVAAIAQAAASVY